MNPANGGSFRALMIAYTTNRVNSKVRPHILRQAIGDRPHQLAKNQTVEAGRKQIGIIMGKLFGEGNELNFDEFHVVREQERAPNLADNYQTLNRYTFSLANAPQANPPAHTPAPGNAGEAKPAEIGWFPPGDRPLPRITLSASEP